jgi:hypothetical protein
MVALAIAGLSARHTADLRKAMRPLRMSSERARTQDRLIGSAIDVASFGAGSPVSHLLNRRRPVLLWIVDLENCSGCFDGVSEWTRLERLEDHDLVLLLMGARTRGVAAQLRALRRTVVGQARREDVLAKLGNILPNTKFLLDAERIAVLVDSRASGKDCGWSFEAQVAAIRGLNSAQAIRPVRKTAP